MPLDAHRVEMTLGIEEVELLRLLYDRHAAARLSQAGIHPELSVIRQMTIVNGQCRFSICCVTPTNVEEQIHLADEANEEPPQESKNAPT